MQDDIVLSCENLVFGHGRALCAPLTWTVRRGETWAIAGSNGCGKTTLLRTVLGFLRPLSGTMECTKSCSYLAQSPEFSAVPARVEDVVGMGAETGHSGLIPFYRRRFAKTVETLLDAFELQSLRRRSMHEISPGERQRALLAQSVVRSPELVCLDEATSASAPNSSSSSPVPPRTKPISTTSTRRWNAFSRDVAWGGCYVPYAPAHGYRRAAGAAPRRARRYAFLRGPMCSTFGLRAYGPHWGFSRARSPTGRMRHRGFSLRTG